MDQRIESSEPRDPEEHPILKDRLVPSDFSGEDLYRLEHDPTKVVRIQPAEQILAEFYRRGEERPVETDEERRHHAVEAVLVASRLFDEIKEKYGIPLPNPRLAVGNTPDGKPAVYTVEDYVQGQLLETCRPEGEEGTRLAHELNGIYAGLARYLADKHGSGENYLYDIFAGGQFMYGTTPTDTERHVYLIDTDIFFEKGGAVVNTPDGPRSPLFSYLYTLADNMVGAEKILGTRFDDARQAIQKFFGGLSEQDREENRVGVEKTEELLR